jgi:hypothetical protein
MKFDKYKIKNIYLFKLLGSETYKSIRYYYEGGFGQIWYYWLLEEYGTSIKYKIKRVMWKIIDYLEQK